MVVIGGGAAGMSASSRIRRLNANAEITVLEETEFVSHAPCGVPYYIEGLFSDISLFMTYTPQFFRENRKIDVRTSAKVTAVDVKSRSVEYVHGGNRNSLEFDYLVYAPGAEPRIPEIQGIQGERVLTVHHPASAQRARVELLGVKSVNIIGGGILGVEMAEALVGLGKRVRILHRGNRLLNRVLDEDLSDVVHQKITSAGAEIVLGAEVEGITEGGKKVITNKGVFEGEATVFTVGVRPKTDLVRGQVMIGEKGGVLTDPHMKTSADSVYAAGDVAETMNIVTGLPDWEPFAPVANKMGYVAGSNIAGENKVFPGTAGTALTKFNDLFIAKTGLTYEESQRIGIRAEAHTVRAKTRARYYPGAKDIYVRLVVEQKDNRIIGAQIVGEEEVAGRIGIVASLIYKHATVEDLFFSELAYLPAISQVWDPLIVAARHFID